jgi:small GTP-binding protein
MGNQQVNNNNKEVEEGLVPPKNEDIFDELSRLNWSDEFSKFTTTVSADLDNFINYGTRKVTPRPRTVTIPNTKQIDDSDYLFIKVLLLGDRNSGKSSLLFRYTKNEFILPEESSKTITVDMDEIKLRMYDGKIVKLLLSSHAGDEENLQNLNSSVEGAMGFIFVYDVTNPKSFENIFDIWLPEIRKNATFENYPIFILGTKADIKDKPLIDMTIIKKLSSEVKAKSFLISSKEAEQTEIDAVFEGIVEEIYKRNHLKIIFPKNEKESFQTESNNSSIPNTDSAPSDTPVDNT